MNYAVAIAAGLVFMLWSGGQQGWAVFAGFLGGVIYLTELMFFDMTSCSCDKGKIWSPLTQTFRVHKKCGGSGVRQRLGRRLWDRRVS